MPRNLHCAAFVPSPIGIAFVRMDEDGRIVIPAELRHSFGERTPPFDVLYNLARRGHATAQAAPGWPPRSERDEVERILKFIARVDPDKLLRDHLEDVQNFARIVACRYIDGRMGKKWQLRVPYIVRTWLGISAERLSGKKKPRRDVAKDPLIIVLGNVGNLELWSESTFKDASIAESSEFHSLRSKAAEVLRHAAHK